MGEELYYKIMNRKDFNTMEMLSKNLPPYEAVTWLGTPNTKLDNQTPYDMIKKGRSERVYQAAYDYIKVYKAKKKKRSSK